MSKWPEYANLSYLVSWRTCEAGAEEFVLIKRKSNMPHIISFSAGAASILKKYNAMFKRSYLRA